MTALRARYGPWALVAGASEGIGAAFARRLAADGLNVVLVARGADKLEALAGELRARVAVRVVTADLGAPDAADVLGAATADLEIGLLVYNACHSVIGEVLALSAAERAATIDVNVRGPVALVARFAPPMVARGRGGIVLMSSLSGFQGTAMVGLYAATKAFDTVLGEALWEELRPKGVDVLVCAAGATRTPGFDRNTPADQRGRAFPMEAGPVADGALAALGGGPLYIPGRLNRLVHAVLSRLPRRVAVRFLSRTTRAMYSGGAA